jgi:hypothetical protein
LALEDLISAPDHSRQFSLKKTVQSGFFWFSEIWMFLIWKNAIKYEKYIIMMIFDEKGL